MKKLALLFWLLPWLALAQVGGGNGPVGGAYGPLAGCAGPLNGCAGPLGQVTQTYVLDQLSAYPAVAYSVRQMTAAQYLPAYDMTVRRSSDNAQTNIGFSGGVENVAALASFCAGTNAYLVTWKDQGSLGSAGDASQSTAASQPQVCAAGVVETQGGVPTVVFTNSTFLNNTGISTIPSTVSSNSVFAWTTSTSSYYPILSASSGSSYLLGIKSDNHLYASFQAGYNPESSVAISSNTLYIGTTNLISGSSSSQVYTNGGSLGTSSPGTGTSTGLVIGKSLINLSESVVILSAIFLRSDQTTLETNQAAFFGIAGVTQ